MAQGLHDDTDRGFSRRFTRRSAAMRVRFSIAGGLAKEVNAAQPRAHLRVGLFDRFAAHGEARADPGAGGEAPDGG
jgi:hypothetical protein